MKHNTIELMFTFFIVKSKDKDKRSQMNMKLFRILCYVLLNFQKKGK